MEKANIFFCDIRGTITNSNELHKDENYEEFVRRLEKLKEVDKLDNLYFSFVSGDHMEDVLSFVEKIKPYLINSAVRLGPQFSSTHVFYNGNKRRCGTGKSMQIKLVLDCANVNKIYFADDTEFYHELLKFTMKEKFPEILYESFVLGNDTTDVTEYKHKEKGLQALNELLSDYIIRRKEMNEEEER